jgi:lipopolysaccharide/colanic/teichoic acid biosynthesis glycosyltransferase
MSSTITLPGVGGHVNSSNDHPRPRGRGYQRWKARLDAALAAVLLVLATPVILLAMLLVRLTSRGPGIYRQQRLGQGGRGFTIYKIRTMYNQSEQRSGIVWSWPGDPRITPLGRWLRAAHIDELPN